MTEQMETPLVPASFWQYLRSMGPGIVIALTWLGAGDLVDSAVAGGNYGYTLMWAMVVALFVRFVFVSIIAKYQLCNQHGESVMAGLRRIHPWVPPFVGVIAIFFAHFYGAFLVKGVGETTVRLFSFGPSWFWSFVWVLTAAGLVLRGTFKPLEFVFFLFLAILSVSLIGVALWSGPRPVEAVKGILLFSIPEQKGAFGVWLVVTSLIGAVGGSIANLLYPYFIQQKGWIGPRFRRLQVYDLAFGTLVLIVLDLSIWTVGAEILNPKGITIESLDDLASLLTIALGSLGGPIFFLGVFAALYSSLLGNAAGYGYMCSDIVRIMRSSKPVETGALKNGNSTVYRVVVLWCLFSPLVWMLPGMPDFITLTIVANAASVIVLPILSGGLWYITARSRFIGPEFRNKLWENTILALLFFLALWGSWNSIVAILEQVR